MTTRARTVTILFTDLVGSTELLQRAGDEQAQRIFKAHHRLLREAVEAHGGHEVKWLGDGLMVAFDSTADAVKCAIAMQQAARRPAAGERLQIRVGLHVGEAFRDESDYFGTSVVIARRLCDKADAGQIYASDLVVRLLEGRQELTFDDLGALALKGIESPVHAHELRYEHDPLAMLAVTPFVGRREELAALQRALDATIGGCAAFVMLAGEPGIGKTRLGEEFAELARTTGAVVLSGHCYEGEWSPPLSPFVEALQAYGASVPPDSLRADLGYHATALARLAPALREHLPEIADQARAETTGERAQVLDGIASWLRRATSRAPIVLLLEDLHWCDDGTAALLRHLGHTMRDVRLLVIGTFRDLEVGHGHVLTDALTDLRRNARLERIAVTGLAHADVAMLLDAVASEAAAPDLALALTAETAGNPLFIREVLLHFAEQWRHNSTDAAPWIPTLRSDDSDLPEGIRDVVARRVARLGEDARAMLLAVCPMLGGFELPVVIALTCYDEARALDAIDEAIGARLLVERGSGASLVYDFHHALIRDALYAPLTASRRAALHRRIVEAIEMACAERLDDYADELAQHCEQGGLARKGVEYLLLSAERARGAYLNTEALARFERAAALLEAGAERADETWCASVASRLHEGVGDVLLLGGSHDDGQARLLMALKNVVSDVAVARLQRKRAVSLITQRRYEEGAAAFAAADTGLEGTSTVRDATWWFEWIQVRIERMWMHYWQGQALAMMQIVENHGADIEEHASRRQLGKYYQARTALGLRHERYRLSPQTRQFAEAALAAVQGAGDTSELAFTHFMLGFSALWMDDFELAGEQFGHAMEWAERTGDITVLSRILTYDAVLKRRLGDVDGVRSRIERLLPVATRGQMLEYVGTAHANLAWVALQDGELVRANDEARRAVETWRRLSITYGFRWTALLVLLDLAGRRSHVAEAHELVTEMLHPTQQLLSENVMAALEAAAATSPDDAAKLAALLEHALIKARQYRYL